MTRAGRERAAKNEALFREVNERIRSVNRGVDGERYEFLCECADRDCLDTVALTIPEYEDVRAVSTRFVVRPGHCRAGIERVIESSARYEVVEKHGVAGETAAARDPRA